MPTEVERTVEARQQECAVRVAVAESLTGGQLAARLARMEGAGAWFRGAVVAYASEVKFDVLHVPVGPVVSAEAAEAMAVNVAKLLGADVGLSLTGVGGPEEQDGEPPGTVWLGVHRPGHSSTRLLRLAGSPAAICEQACLAAIEELADLLASVR